MKRKELATPAGIDHDYNFLTGVERAVDRAEQEAERKGIPLDSKPGSTGMKLEQGLRESMVAVRKSPKGMSRQKENRTAWDGKYEQVAC